MTQAELRTDGARPAVRLERELVDPPAVVWRAITEREQLRAWFPCDVDVAGGVWEVGAAIAFRFGEEMSDMTLTGEVFVVDEPKVLVFSWGEERLRFELAPHGSGTHLVLIDELPADAAARNAAGWDECLDRLAGLEPGDWKARFDTYAATFEPLVGPQSGPPTA
ncbi:SRPBCC domain-containing protein [Nocardia sp. NPDC050175]|uniref:SRPBCC domain-containing protein n=1 Tax=Nocardia sp. NPDC050175 TaxID=3364317 RepID=UPI0037967CD6